MMEKYFSIVLFLVYQEYYDGKVPDRKKLL